MDPWLRPALTLAAAVILPLASLAALGAVLDHPSARGAHPNRAGWACAVGVIGLVGWLGATALGPQLVEGPWGMPAWGFAATTVVVAAVTFTVRLRRTSTEPSASPPHARRMDDVVGLLFGACIGAVLLGLGAFGWLATAVEPTAGPDAAETRTRIHPWDANAWLALARAARQGDRIDEARRFTSYARRAGADEIDMLTLEAELLAAEGRCDEALATFERTLAIRAERALAANERLVLGHYELPPTLVVECDAR